MLKLAINMYVRAKDPVLIRFFWGVSLFLKTKQPPKQQTMYKIQKVVESIMNLSAYRVLPLHSKDTLLLYSLTGSN